MLALPRAISTIPIESTKTVQVSKAAQLKFGQVEMWDKDKDRQPITISVSSRRITPGAPSRITGEERCEFLSEFELNYEGRHTLNTLLDRSGRFHRYATCESGDSMQ